MNARFVFSRTSTPVGGLAVSRQPGNNFRVAASCDPNALGRLTVTNNVPDTIYVPGSDAAVSGFTGQITPLLTVWRRLHIELDSMAAVGTNNTITGRVIRINGNSMAPTREVVVNQTLHDGSPHLNLTPKGNGRFENGRITVGMGSGATTTTNLLGNGVIGAGEYVAPRSNAVVTIPFTITKGAATTNGLIVAMTPGHPRSLFTVNVALPQNTYNNGTLTVAGHVFNVHQNQINVVEVKHSNVTLNFTGLHDDDDDTLLPRLVAIGTEVADLYAPCYIVPLANGGGNPNNISTNLAFRLNLPSGGISSYLTATGSFQSDANRANDFWIAYLLTAFQSSASLDVNISPPRADRDPNTEGPLRGVTLSNHASVMFIEELRDAATPGSEQRIAAHEIAHQFDLDDGTGGLMDNVDTPGIPFTANHLDAIRSRKKSPGR